MNRILLQNGQMPHFIDNLKHYQYYDFVNNRWENILFSAGIYYPVFYYDDSGKEFDKILLEHPEAIGFFYKNETFAVVRKVQ